MMLISVFVLTPVQEQEFCCFIKEIGNSSIVFCGPEQDAMELELELFWKSALI